ncbi:MAG TPA: LacI family DNA-binding transcriptional regulator [Actinomycetota bacterium]
MSEVTIVDVARHAGVSITTVSHALSGNRRVAEETRARIQHSIRELGYRPNAFARSLRTERSHMVALIIPDITNPYYPTLARGLQDALHAGGYQSFVCNTDGLREEERSFLKDSLQRRVDGIAFAAFATTARMLAPVIQEHIPLISIGTAIRHRKVDCVRTDDVAGARDATRYLIERGYDPIGMIGGPAGMSPSDHRLEGHRAALAEAGLAFDAQRFAVGDFTRAGGAAAMRELLERRARPRALFCANDLMAIGAMDALREAELGVPRDVAVMGYDDIEAAALVTPDLTTVVNPAYEMGRACGRLLLERMSGADDGPRREVVIPHRLIPRASA